MSKTPAAVCATLEIEDLYTKSENTLSDLFMLQKDIQENVYKYDFEALRSGPLSNMHEFIAWNIQAQHSEIQEGLEALGGINHGIGAGIWKPWKSNHKLAETMTFDEMHPDDKKELKMEFIDELHFLFNKMHAVGMTPEEVFNFYYAKNLENRKRQENNY